MIAECTITTYGWHIDPSMLEMLLILKYNKGLWGAKIFFNIMNIDTSQLADRNRTIPASVDRVSDCASVRNLIAVFEYLIPFPPKINTIGQYLEYYWDYGNTVIRCPSATWTILQSSSMQLQ